MPSAFIAHSSIDKQFARQLANDLRSNGVRVWIDEAELLVGDSLLTKIAFAIHEMDYLIAILSPNSVNSNWVQKELNIAMSRQLNTGRIIVLPIIAHECEIPLYLTDVYYLRMDTQSNYSVNFENLLKRTKIPLRQPLESFHKGSVSGRVMVNDNKVGLSDAYVAIVSENDPSQIYKESKTDARGFYNFVDLKSTSGQRLYRVYAKDSLFGYGFSPSFYIEDGKNACANVIIYTIPAYIGLKSEKNSIIPDNIDNTTIIAFIRDALNNPVADGFPIKFVLNSRFIGSGSLSPVSSNNPSGNIVEDQTKDGCVKAKFGWATNSGMVTIQTVCVEDPNIYATINILIN